MARIIGHMRPLRLCGENFNPVKERWLAVSTVAVFALALAGAVYAVYALIPPLLADPQSKTALRVFLIVLAAAFAAIFLLFRIRRKR